MPDSQIVPERAVASSLTHSEALDQLGAALAAAQAEIVGAKKDSANPFFKSSYADLASVWEACRKPLTTHGLSVIQMPVTNGSVGVTTMLLHKSGQWIASTCEADPKDRGPQAIGSVITYLRRYALAAFAGVPQIDDDGESGEGRKTDAHATPAHKPGPLPKSGSVISEAQAARLFAIAKKSGWPEPEVRNLIGLYGYAHTRDIHVQNYDQIVAKLSEPFQAVA